MATYNIVSAIRMNNADMIVRIPLNLRRNIQKKAQARSQQFSFPNPTPGLMPAAPAPAFAIPRPTLDLINMHGKLGACSVPVSADSVSVHSASVDFTFPCLLGIVPVSALEPVDPMHDTRFFFACACLLPVSC
jgi:hypothetical protein